MPSQTPRKRGRPPAGDAGEKVSTYPQLTVRLPAATRAKLNTLSLLLATPLWRVIENSIDVYVQHLPAEEQRILGSIVDRLARGDWPITSHWAAAYAKPAAKVTPRPPKTRDRSR